MLIAAIVLSCCLLLPLNNGGRFMEMKTKKGKKKQREEMAEGTRRCYAQNPEWTDRQKLIHFPTMTRYWWFRTFMYMILFKLQSLFVVVKSYISAKLLLLRTTKWGKLKNALSLPVHLLLLASSLLICPSLGSPVLFHPMFNTCSLAVYQGKQTLIIIII